MQHGRLTAAGGTDECQERGARHACDELGHEPLAPEEELGVVALEAAQALERRRAQRLLARRGRCVRERSRPLARLEHTVGQLLLQLAQVASTGGCSARDVANSAGGLVQGRRQGGLGEFPASGVALLGPLRESLRERGVQGPQIGTPRAERRRFLVQLREDGSHLRCPPERRMSGHALVQHAGQRVDVGPTVDVVAGDLLGRDVVDGAEERAVRLRPGAVRLPGREAEVRQVRMIRAVGAATRVQEHVGRLHVAVDQPPRVRCVERARHLRDDPGRDGRLQAAVGESALEVAPLDVAHGDEQEVLGLARLVDGHDVRVVDRGGQLRLPQEPAPARRVLAQCGRQQLERDAALESRILGQVDDARSAPAEQRPDPVPGEHGSNPRIVNGLHCSAPCLRLDSSDCHDHRGSALQRRCTMSAAHL